MEDAKLALRMRLLRQEIERVNANECASINEILELEQERYTLLQEYYKKKFGADNVFPIN